MTASAGECVVLLADDRHQNQPGVSDIALRVRAPVGLGELIGLRPQLRNIKPKGQLLGVLGRFMGWSHEPAV